MKEFLKNILPFNNRTEMPKALFVVKKILAFWLCYIAGLFLAEGVVILLHFALGKNMLVGDVFDGQTITLITYYGYIIMSGVALLYWKLIEKKPLSEMGLTKRFGNYFIGIIVGVLLLAVSVFAIVLTGNIEYHGIFENADILMIILLFGGFIIQGATEEILCRGIVLHTLKEKTPTWIAIAVSTVLFIIPHWSSLFEGGTIYGVIGVANLVLISIIFSLLTIRFKSIWVACGLHSFWNAILYCILGLNLSGKDETVTAIFNMQSVGNNIWNGGAYGIEASIVTTVVLTIAAALICYMNRKKIDKRGN
ncbi:CPBP family intramembrane glutamic endopeptidase [Ruminococcus sp.]|uniref:CPBP family intramembrane glutamic endopeptidase n=1 Tax=Ruminococcus sp. TaxID=41978 RepID=UPI002636F638|nr:type II CAAX endopeptidase family protein [Ruminococcus sp.]MDD6989057.1 type II CAAX endopeptidase family protein [Ruminococcus sp.]MDY6202849.1 type II CAAX endopeptidase family protein [Ruminococcus sp.]